MIPETGNRKELKRAWFDSLVVPVVGEVYQYHSPIKTYYRVVEVVATLTLFSKNLKGFVRVEAYLLLEEGGCYKRAGAAFQFTLREWRMNIRHRQMTYHAPEIPTVLGIVV